MKSVAFFLLAAAVLLAREAAPQPTAPTTSPENYYFAFSSPSGCAPSSCTIFAGVNLNQGDSNYVDIYLEGAARGYVAVGFSATPDMFNADVVACTRDSSNDMVQPLDTWNPNSPTRSNQRDPTMERDLTLFNGSYVNGRIQCSVVKRIIGSDSTQDINLNTNLYMMYAFRSGSLTSPTSLEYHSTRAVRQTTFSFPPIAATDLPPTTPSTEAQTTPTTDGPTTEGLMTTAGTTSEPTTQAPQGPVAPTTRPEFYDFQLSIPPDCAPSDCTIFAGVNLNEGNESFVDIYLEGVALGYVAIGFTETQTMFDADVVACTRDASNNDMVQALDTWNPSGTRGNQQDNTMDQDLMFFSGSFSNGRIQCSVAKRIIGSDPEQDIDLNSDLYLIIAAGPNIATPTSILEHNPQSRNYSTETFSFPPMVATNAPTTTGDETPPPPPEEPTIEPEEYRLLFGQPAGCSRTNCDIFVAIDTNNASSGYLDIYLEGEANGWVAVGFTKTSSMFSADVVACNRIPNSDNVEALDTWNPANERGSPTDAQQDIVLFNSGINGSRLYCTVAKRITSDDTDNDIDLDQGSCYCLVYARSDNSTEGALIRHTGNNRFTSGETCDIELVMDNVQSTGISDFRHTLTMAHGILMIAWMSLCW